MRTPAYENVLSQSCIAFLMDRGRCLLLGKKDGDIQKIAAAKTDKRIGLAIGLVSFDLMRLFHRKRPSL